MEKTETAIEHRQLAIMTTTLVALLLVSQLSLASGRSDARFLLDSNYYDSLETVDLESNNNKHFTPDFIQYNSEQKQNNIFACSSHGLTPIYVENHTHSASIRSPPLSV